MPLTNEQLAKIRQHAKVAVEGLANEVEGLPEKTDLAEVEAYLHELAAAVASPPRGVLSQESAKLAVSVLGAFPESSLYRDYQDEDKWTDAQYSRMLTEIQRIAAGTTPPTSGLEPGAPEPFWLELVDDDDPSENVRQTFLTASELAIAAASLIRERDGAEGVAEAQLGRIAELSTGQQLEFDLATGRIYTGLAEPGPAGN